MEVKKGYIQTDIGIIPTDWLTLKIGEIAHVATGTTPPTRDLDNYGEDFLFVGPGDLGHGKYVTNTEKKLSTKGFNLSRKYPTHTILYTCIGSTIGKAGIASIALTSNQQINGIFPNDKYSTDYLYYSLSLVAPRIKALAGAQAVPLVNKSEFEETVVPFPPTLAEQTAIATALSETDTLIQSLEKLVAKKRAIKQGAMQELLTGKRRLPGFAGKSEFQKTEIGKIPADWAVVRMGDVGQTFIGLTYSPKDVAEHGTIVLRSSNVQNGKLAYEDNVFVQMDLPPRVMVQEGDILICVRNGSRQLIGKCALIDKTAYGAAFGAFMSLYRSKHSSFIFRQFQSAIIQRQINETLGATINQITNKDMARFLVCLPKNTDEENAIVEVLSDMDSELTVLEAKLSKYRTIKQGMMQELLTGKTRLI